VKSSNCGNSANDGNWGSEFVGFLNGGTTDEQHAVNFLVVSGILVFTQLLDEVGDGGDSLGISSVVSNNTVVEEDSDFNPEGFGFTFLNSDFVKDFLDVIKVNNTSGHGHQPVGKGLAKSFKTDKEG